jgi:hypothetical protein
VTSSSTRARVAQVLGRPVPSHEQIDVAVLELCDRLEEAEQMLDHLGIFEDDDYDPAGGIPMGDDARYSLRRRHLGRRVETAQVTSDAI